MNYLLAITYIFIFLDPLLPRNPKDGVDGGSIPTFDEKVVFFCLLPARNCDPIHKKPSTNMLGNQGIKEKLRISDW